MFFAVALVLVLVLPLVATTVAYAHARRSPTVAPIHADGPVGSRPLTPRATDDFGSGLTTGVLASVFLPPLAELVVHGPRTRLVVLGALVLVPLAVYLFARPRGQYARGLAAGAAIAGIAVPLVFLALFSTIGLVVGWF